MEDWKLRLRQAREDKKLNKTAFARLIKVSNPTVTDWEKSVADGGIKEIAGGNLTKVCATLGVSPDWLLHGSGPGPAHQADQSQHEPSPRQVAHAAPAGQDQEGRVAEALKLKVETAAELRLLSVYRLANEDGRAAIDGVVEQIRRRLGDDIAGLNQR